jgi:hypothetical protein
MKLIHRSADTWWGDMLISQSGNLKGQYVKERLMKTRTKRGVSARTKKAHKIKSEMFKFSMTFELDNKTGELKVKCTKKSKIK